MKKMQRLVYPALVAMVFGAVSITPAEAAYKPKTNINKLSGQAKIELKAAVAFLKGLPKSERWAFIAERLGLLFMPSNGKPGHRDNSWVRIDGAHFIGADGKEYDAYAEISHGLRTSDWPKKTDTIDRLGREEVFSLFASEVSALVLANARYQLDKMHEEHAELRDLYLAHLAKLCYFSDTEKYYDVSTWTGPHQLPVRSYVISGGKFVDINGEEHDVLPVYKQNTSLGGDRWTILNVCTHHVGKKDILDLFPDEVKKLRANYKKRMKGVINNAKKQTNRERTEKDPESKQSMEVDRAIEEMKSFSSLLRAAIMAEKMGLLFIPDGRDAYASTITNDEDDHTRYYSVNSDAHFIGEDGKMHLFEDVIKNEVRDRKGMTEKWRRVKQAIYNHGEEAIFAPFEEEFKKIVLSSAKYFLDSMMEIMREAWLVYVAEFVYEPNGGSPYEEDAPHKWTQPGTINLSKQNEWRNISHKARYISSQGREILVLWSKNEHKKLADMANWCRCLLGTEEILNLYPDEVKKLRENYEKRMKELKK